MELKLKAALDKEIPLIAFNRTRMELKLVIVGVPFDVRRSFNRTRMELKLQHVTNFARRYRHLLIVPEWN